MIFTTNTIENKELNEIQNFFMEYDSEVKTISEEETKQESCVSKYISSLVSSKYQQSIEDIENTKIGNRVVRKRSLQQVMQESFFYGANRFGNNFIA